MHRVAHAEHPAKRIAHGILLVDGPGRHGIDPDRNGVGADQLLHDRDCLRIARFGWTAGQIIAPHADPFGPRPNHAQHANADAIEPAARLQQPEHVTGAVLRQFGQIGGEFDVERTRIAQCHLPFERQPDMVRNFGSGPIRADQILRAHLIFGTRQPVTQGCSDTVCILFVRQIFGLKPHIAAAQGALGNHQRFEIKLWQVAHRTRAGQIVNSLRSGMVRPGMDAPELFANHAGGKDMAHHLLWCGQSDCGAFQPEIAQNFHRPLVGDVRPWARRRCRIFVDHKAAHAKIAQQQRTDRASRPCPDDQNVGFHHFTHVLLPIPACLPAINDAHGPSRLAARMFLLPKQHRRSHGRPSRIQS